MRKTQNCWLRQHMGDPYQPEFFSTRCAGLMKRGVEGGSCRACMDLVPVTIRDQLGPPTTFVDCFEVLTRIDVDIEVVLHLPRGA